MVALLSADTFNRTNSASTLGSTNGAGSLDPIAWVPNNGTWGITSNQAYNPSNTARAVATIDTGHANVDVRLTLGSSGGSTFFGIVIRYIDASNMIFIEKTSSDGLNIVKRVAGVDTSLLSIASIWASNSQARVTAINNVITVYRNNVAVAQIIESFNRSATKCGMISDSNGAYQFDDWSVYTVDVPAEIALDSFNRVNGLIGSTDGTGTLDPVAWSALNSHLSHIVSNQAAIGGSSTDTIDPLSLGGSFAQGNIEFINAGVSDIQIYLKMASPSSSGSGIIFRYVDVDNYWVFFANQATDTRLFKREGGVWTNMSGTLTGLTATNRTMTVKLSGSTIVCYVNGVQVFSVADTFLHTATKHGFVITNTATVDDFQMWAGDTIIPVIAVIGPTQGPAGGGTHVTIAGNNFTGATAVSFGATPATSFTVVNDGYITAVAPAHAPGLLDIIVTNANGDSVPGVQDQFTYIQPSPLVSTLTPTHGVPAGGTSVVIAGAYFTGATSVTFGGTPAASFTVDSDGQITAVTPAHVSGVVPVVVTTPAGHN